MHTLYKLFDFEVFIDQYGIGKVDVLPPLRSRIPLPLYLSVQRKVSTCTVRKTVEYLAIVFSTE